MHPLRAVVEEFRGCRVVVIGDVMLDEYLHGTVSRISPEAPVPVLEVRAHDWRLGGAANAAAGIQALGGATTLVGVVGKDEAATILGERLADHGVASAMVIDPDRPTTKKTRLVAQQQQIVRVDHEKRHPVAGTITDGLRRAIDQAMHDAQACVLSDYAKGVVTGEIARHAIDTARAAGIPVIVDPKQKSFAAYRGATVITPNLHELEAAAPGVVPFEVERAATSVLGEIAGTAVLVTRSADGMTLFRAGRDPFHVAAMAKEVFDVTGAGDTVVATIALALGARVAIEQAIELASIAAAISVSKRGTSTVIPGELLAAIDAAPDGKVMESAGRSAAWRDDLRRPR
ncbi:MAG TPA: D-glycero-beta-D-manno-heptose-7-phosphate kinase [Kofleriaceae bacterium]|nr:D-glycero-beta-D-manno-heptose-7-phosphate kinase [Kofleriaceae bacterium]